jgi:prolipoprotein diacylglyceryltransferase
MLEGLWALLLVVSAGMIWHLMPFSGALFLYVVAGYALGRLVLESSREHPPGTRAFTIHHAISIGMIVLSFVAFTANMAKAGGFDG